MPSTTPTELHRPALPASPPRARIRRRLPPTQPQGEPAQTPLAIAHRPPGELAVSRAKLRKYDARHREHLLASVKRWGVVVPVLVDAEDKIIAGHEVVAVARELDLATVPTIKLADLSDAQARTLRIALTKIGELSKWNPKTLKDELGFLADFDRDLLTFTAFSSAELDAIFNVPKDESDDDLPPLLREAVSRLGDLWVFEGGHRLGCLDVLDEASLPALMAGELAGLVLCDPPYNVEISNNVTSRSGVREFAMASGEMSPEAFTAFLRTVFERLSAHSKDGSLSLQFLDWRSMREMLDAGQAVYSQLINLAVWAKSNPGMGSLWRSAHELCFCWKNGTAQHINNIELGRNGRNRSNLWAYPRQKGFVDGHGRDKVEHVTPKNVAMMQDAILDVSRRGDIVLDAFAGSGTTLVAAHRAKRRGYGAEIDPLYADLTVRRMEICTRGPARHAATGLTFSEMAAERGITLPPRARRA